ncbi:MAG: hypothetical protein IH591_16805 [Bacteroidales bacterium]|nr:hypothetical protein [Bacteroidales bacterium]
MNRIILLFILLIGLGSGCNKNEAYLKDLEKFVTDVEINSKDYTEAEWIEKDYEFTKLSEVRFSEIANKLTPEERSRVNELIGKYRALKIRKGIGDFKTEIKDRFEQGKTIVKELILPDSAQKKDAIERAESEIKNISADTVRNTKIE